MIFQGVPLWIHPCQTYEYCCPVLSGSCIHLSFKYYAAISFNSLCLLGNFSCFLSSADFFQNQLFLKILSGIQSECQTVWIKIRPDILDLGPNCLQRLPADDTNRQRNVSTCLHITTLPCPICNQHLSDISITTMLSNTGTVLPTMSDSDIVFCLQLLSKHQLVQSTWAYANR